jgi:hypothetical protein
LIKVWQMVDDLGIPRERLGDIGWTKMAVLAENCEPEEVEDALDLAEAHIAKELPAALKGTLPKRKARTVKLRLTPRQYERFEAHEGEKHPYFGVKTRGGEIQAG